MYILITLEEINNLHIMCTVCVYTVSVTKHTMYFKNMVNSNDDRVNPFKLLEVISIIRVFDTM